MSLKKLSALRLLAQAAQNERPLLVAIVRKQAPPSIALLDALGALPEAVSKLVDIVQVDIDEAEEVMSELRVSYEPELILFDAGRIIERTDGEMESEQIAGLVQHALAPR